MSEVIWLNIKGYEGKYQISSDFRVRHIYRDEYGSVVSAKEIAVVEASNGKKYVQLYTKQKRTCCMLHNLYSEAFDIPVKEVNRVLYEGFSWNPQAKVNVRNWLLGILEKCQNSNGTYSEEEKYIRMFLKEL